MMLKLIRVTNKAQKGVKAADLKPLFTIVLY